MSGASPLAIVTALKEEWDAILCRARDVRFDQEFLADASIGDVDVVVAMTGDGMARAARGAAALCDASHPSALIGAGVAGALSRRLDVGQILASRQVRDASGEGPLPDATLLARAVAAGAAEAAFVTVERPVTAASEKAELARTIEDGTPAAVDTESAAWARAAAARGIPFIVIRAVSDRAEEELPEYLERCVGSNGSLRRSAVVAHALTHPSTIPTLWRMRSRVADGTARLSEFLEKMLRERT